MHLRDALIDLRGNLFAEGTISFPPDPEGVFEVPQHTHMAIDRSGGIVRPALVGRGPTHGFVTPTLLSPIVQLPKVLGELISNSLRHGAREPVSISLAHIPRSDEDVVAGHLAFETGGLGHGCPTNGPPVVPVRAAGALSAEGHRVGNNDLVVRSDLASRYRRQGNIVLSRSRLIRFKLKNAVQLTSSAALRL